jgi:hypothetical protein
MASAAIFVYRRSGWLDDVAAAIVQRVFLSPVRRVFTKLCLHVTVSLFTAIRKNSIDKSLYWLYASVMLSLKLRRGMSYHRLPDCLRREER